MSVKRHAANGGVEGSEHARGSYHSGGGQSIKQSGLAGVGVSHQRHHVEVLVAAMGAMQGALRTDALDAFGQNADTAADATAVHFQLLLARRAKISRMIWVRSITFRSINFSRLRSCVGVRSLSKITRSAPAAYASVRTSCTLPRPNRVAGSGSDARCTAVPTTRAPALAVSS